jgi:hypothetical protein
MRILVLYSHPLPESFCAANFAATCQTLRNAGHEVDACDLYAEGFSPVMSADERRGYHDPATNRAPVNGYVERLLAAEALVLEAAPIIPIYFNTHVYLLHPAVHGWQPTPMDHSDYRYVWLEK